MNDLPWYIKSAMIALLVWCSLNVGIMSWQMILSVYVATVQAPQQTQALQRAQQENQALQQKLDQAKRGADPKAQ